MYLPVSCKVMHSIYCTDYSKFLYTWYIHMLEYSVFLGYQISWNVVAERSSALDSSSGVVRMWVRTPAWPVAAVVSLSKTLNRNCFVLRMGRIAVGPVCCVMQGSTLAVARSPNASENGGGRVKTLPSVARRTSQNIVTDRPRLIYYM